MSNSIIGLIMNGEYMTAIIQTLSRCFVIFCCTPFHELAHGFDANKLGDHTAKNQGRLTFNPFAHLDPLGTIMIFIFGIGYAKPVPVNPMNLKNPKRDMALVSLAGPVANIIMAFGCCFCYVACFKFGFSDIFMLFFYFAALVNVSLAVFNLLPIPPLDGSKILAAFLPNKVYYKYMKYERYVMIAVMLLLFVGVLDGLISELSHFLMAILLYIPSLIFGV